MKAAILTLGCYPSSGGPSKSVRAFQRALDARVIAWVHPEEYAREPLVFESPTVVLGSRLPGLRQLQYPAGPGLAAAAEIVAGSDIVSCHLFWRWHARWLAGLAREQGVPYWLVPHGGLDPYVFQSGRLIKSLFAGVVAKPFLEGARAVVCSTRREWEKLRVRVPRAEPCILPWPLDPGDVRHRDDARRKAVREALGIPENAFCLVYLGRLHTMKRPLETIASLAHTRTANVHLILVGNPYGITMAECEAQARKLGLAGRVHAVGGVFGAAKHDYFDAADAFISLSHRENFNFAATEAMASGLPVILSPGNDLAGALAGLDCGWMLPHVDAAAAAIADAAALTPYQLAAKGQRAREWANESLQFDVFRDRLRAFAARIIDERARN